MTSLVRGILAGMLLVTPAIGDRLGTSVFPIACGVLLAHNGSQGKIVPGAVAFLIGTELLWGIDLGVLSLAFIGTALLLRMGQYFISLPSGAFIFSLILAYVLSLIMVGGSLIVQSIYGQGSLMMLAANAYRLSIPQIAMTMLGIGAALGVLHRTR